MGIVFVLALLFITAIELISGKPLADIFGERGERDLGRRRLHAVAGAHQTPTTTTSTTGDVVDVDDHEYHDHHRTTRRCDDHHDGAVGLDHLDDNLNDRWSAGDDDDHSAFAVKAPATSP